jgi:hypothetical protein
VNMKGGDLNIKLKGNSATIVWKDKWKVNILTNIHSLSLEGNFYDEHGKAVKLTIIPDYNRRIGYVDKLDCMTNSYSVSRWTWKWTKKPFFHILDHTILNSLSFSSLVAQNYHTDSSDWHWWGP